MHSICRAAEPGAVFCCFQQACIRVLRACNMLQTFSQPVSTAAPHHQPISFIKKSMQDMAAEASLPFPEGVSYKQFVEGQSTAELCSMIF